MEEWREGREVILSSCCCSLQALKGSHTEELPKFDEALLGLTSISTQNENISERSDLGAHLLSCKKEAAAS